MYHTTVLKVLRLRILTIFSPADAKKTHIDSAGFLRIRSFKLYCFYKNLTFNLLYYDYVILSIIFYIFNAVVFERFFLTAS